MRFIKRIIRIICAKNGKNMFKFIEVIQRKLKVFFPDTVYSVALKEFRKSANI